MRNCRSCIIAKPLSEFGVRRASADGLMKVCKSCNREKQKAQYSNNKKYYLDRNRDLRTVNRGKYKASKEGKPCAMCHNSFPQVCMDYDHVDPSTKKMCVAQMLGHSWSAIQEEIDKCVLLCSNCHRIKTYETTERQVQHKITTSPKRNRS